MFLLQYLQPLKMFFNYNCTKYHNLFTYKYNKYNLKQLTKLFLLRTIQFIINII